MHTKKETSNKAHCHPLQKGLEMGGFIHRWQQEIAQRKVMAEKKKNEKSKTKT
jgi:hypothetical protein